jgi:hypothetical protein
MNNPDIFTDVIVQYCDTETLSRLARVSCMHHSVVRKNSIYRQFAQCWQKQYDFHEVCRRGHIHVAQWMYKRKAAAHKSLDLIFARVCLYGQLEVAKWLYDICPRPLHRATINLSLRWAHENEHLVVAEWLNTTFN